MNNTSRSSRPLLTDLAERVERGAKLLDLKMPGWWRSIRTTHLDMNMGAIDFDEDGRPTDPDWCGCIGAQLALTHKRLRDHDDWASWTDAMDALDLHTLPEQESHGFVEVNEGEGGDLDALWIEQVRARRKAAA